MVCAADVADFLDLCHVVCGEVLTSIASSRVAQPPLGCIAGLAQRMLHSLPVTMSQPPSSSTLTAQLRCDYCELPVSGVSDGPVYCCTGCRFAAAVTGERGDLGESRWLLTGLGISVFFTLNVVMMTMALWAYADRPESRFAAALADVLRWIALVSTIPVLVWLGVPLARQAGEQLRRRHLSTDLLLLTGVIAAFSYSAVSTLRGVGHVYFEVSCVILVLVTLGRWLEATGRLKASQALHALESLLPERVQRVREFPFSQETEELSIPLGDVRIGDRLRVRAGERIPSDGQVVRGSATVDEQFFTGESWPAEKGPGYSLLGGTLNLDGDLVVEVTAPPQQGALGRLVESVRTAQLSKGHYEQVADRCSRSFFPVIGIVTVGTAAWHSVNNGIEAAFLNALAVVLIACPCALALATPLAVWAALGSAARRGVLLRGGEAIERLAVITTLRLDKTGTLTTGTPAVKQFLCEQAADRETVLQRVAAMSDTSTHLFSKAIRRFVETTPPPLTLKENRSIAGRGVVATIVGDTWPTFLGSVRLMDEYAMAWGPRLSLAVSQLPREADSCVLIGWGGQVRGLFLLREELRPEVQNLLAECPKLDLSVEVLTGDHFDRGARLHQELGIPVHAGLLPEEKLEVIRKLQGEGHRVAMVGDGVNDAPALALADVGIAMGCGTDVTRESADVCLIRNDLRSIPWAIELSRNTVSTIRQNLFWAFAYNGIGVALAACGLLHPAIAAVLMVLSSLMVLGNSLKLQDVEGQERESDESHAFDAETVPPDAQFVERGRT